MHITALVFRLRVVFTMRFVYKGHAHQIIDSLRFQLTYDEGETPTTCLTNHKSSISHHITTLVINSLGGRHTHTQYHRHRGQKQFQETRRVPPFGQRAPGLKILNMYNINISGICHVEL